MTRDEFIDGYMARSDIDPKLRLPDGFDVPGYIPRIALPCSCGDETCAGWAMIANDPETVAAHRQLYQRLDVVPASPPDKGKTE